MKVQSNIPSRHQADSRTSRTSWLTVARHQDITDSLVAPGLLGVRLVTILGSSYSGVVRDGCEDGVLALVLAAEHLVELLAHPDEGGAARQLLQLAAVLGDRRERERVRVRVRVEYYVTVRVAGG
jgi:hypothetical protein